MSKSQTNTAVRLLVASLFVAGGSAAALSEKQAPLELTADAAKPAKPAPKASDASVAVPDGNQLAFWLSAKGVQIYVCQATNDVYGWVLQAPDAKLYNGKEVAGTHFAGPTWKATDGSQAVGKKLAAFTASPKAVPELLLQATSTTGEGTMTGVTYIQRLATTGGLAPAKGCDEKHAAKTTKVQYTASYLFYKAAH